MSLLPTVNGHGSTNHITNTPYIDTAGNISQDDTVPLFSYQLNNSSGYHNQWEDKPNIRNSKEATPHFLVLVQ